MIVRVCHVVTADGVALNPAAASGFQAASPVGLQGIAGHRGRMPDPDSVFMIGPYRIRGQRNIVAAVNAMSLVFINGIADEGHPIIHVDAMVLVAPGNVLKNRAARSCENPAGPIVMSGIAPNHRTGHGENPDVPVQGRDITGQTVIGSGENTDTVISLGNILLDDAIGTGMQTPLVISLQYVAYGRTRFLHLDTVQAILHRHAIVNLMPLPLEINATAGVASHQNISHAMVVAPAFIPGFVDSMASE